MIEITSKREGFRRAGVVHSVQPAVYPDDAFTAEEWTALEAEAHLVLREVPNKGTAEKSTRKTKDAK